MTLSTHLLQTPVWQAWDKRTVAAAMHIVVVVAAATVAPKEVTVAALAVVAAATVTVANCSLMFRTGCRSLHLQPDCRNLDNTFIKTPSIKKDVDLKALALRH